MQRIASHFDSIAPREKERHAISLWNERKPKNFITGFLFPKISGISSISVCLNCLKEIFCLNVP